MEERKQKKIGNEEGKKMTLKRERRVSACLISLFSRLLHFLKFTEYSLDKKRGDGRTETPRSANLNPKACLVIKGT